MPKREGGFCPILDLGPINRALGKRPFRMSPRGLVCVRGFKGRVLSHSDSTASQTFFLNSCQMSGRSTAFQYSVLPSGLLWPHTLSKCINAALPPQIEWKAHPQLSGRLADFSSVPGYAYQPHRLAAYSLEVPTAMSQHAESILARSRGDGSPPLARSRGDESLPLLRSRGDEIPPLARSSRGQFSSLHLFRQGSSVQLKVFQRLLGLKVADSAVLHPGLLHMRLLQLWLESRVP